MKKMFIFMSIAVALIVGQVHAIEYSIGFSMPGIGLGILRGDDAKEATDFFDDNGFKKDFGLSMFPVVQLDVMIEFLPYLALETGIGYGFSTVSYTFENSDARSTIELKRDGIIIPLMVRGQYEFERATIYGSIGPKFVFPISEYGTQTSEDKTAGTTDKEDLFDHKTSFTMDLAFAIGSEFRIIDSHYIGLRLGYDLNLISPINKANDNPFTTGTGKIESAYHDNFNVSLTYRYAFNSKWREGV